MTQEAVIEWDSRSSDVEANVAKSLASTVDISLVPHGV